MSRDEYGFDPGETLLVEDNPFWDCTDGAHPAWWRGHDYTAAKMHEQLCKALGIPTTTPWQTILAGIKEKPPTT